MKPKKIIEYHYRGHIERIRRGGRSAWYAGYSANGERGPLYPWMIKRECQADAKAQGARARFVDGRK